MKFSSWKLSGMFDSVSDMRNYFGISSNEMGNTQVTEKLLAMSDAEKEQYYDLTLDFFVAFRAIFPCVQGKIAVDELKGKKDKE